MLCARRLSSQAPQHFRPFDTQATCDGYFACQPTYLLGHFPDSSMFWINTFTRPFEDECRTLSHASMGFQLHFYCCCCFLFCFCLVCSKLTEPWGDSICGRSPLEAFQRCTWNLWGDSMCSLSPLEAFQRCTWNLWGDNTCSLSPLGAFQRCVGNLSGDSTGSLSPLEAFQRCVGNLWGDSTCSLSPLEAFQRCVGNLWGDSTGSLSPLEAFQRYICGCCLCGSTRQSHFERHNLRVFEVVDHICK